MVIFEDYSWQMNGEYPDFDYTRYEKIYDKKTHSYILEEKKDYVDTDNPVVYVIPDNSPLASLVVQYAPNVQIIVDNEGTVTDVIEYYSLDAIIKLKSNEINNSCNSLICQGVDYNSEHYDLTDEDQINMLAWTTIAQSGSSVPYHSSGNPCRVYSPQEFLGLVQAVTQFKTYHLTYCNLLKQQIANMTDIEEIKSVTYGVTQLNETYQAIMTQVLGGEINENSNQESDSI